MDTAAMGMLMICAIILLVWAIFSLCSYILRGIGMYTIAKRLGISHAWLAFVPFARTYLHGELAGTILLKKKSIQNPGIWLLALPFLYGAVYSIFNAVLCSMGLGVFLKFGLSMPYNTNIHIGNITGMVVIFLVLMVIMLICTAFYNAFEVLVNHQILERFTSKNLSIVHAVLCIIIPMYESVCFFVMRSRPFQPGMEPPAPAPFMQAPPPDPYYSPSSQGHPGSSTQEGYGNWDRLPSSSCPEGGRGGTGSADGIQSSGNGPAEASEPSPAGDAVNFVLLESEGAKKGQEHATNM